MEQETQQILPLKFPFLSKWGCPGSSSQAVQRKTIILQPPKDLPESSPKRSPGLTSTDPTQFHINGGVGFNLYHSKPEEGPSIPLDMRSFVKGTKKSKVAEKGPLLTKSKKISKVSSPTSSEKKSNKKVYEISRFFVKNYVGALKSTVYNPNCEADIIKFLGCGKDDIIKIRQELEKLLAENPKHNRMQMYKVLTNPLLNRAFQYFLRRKVVSWIFTSSKMQDKYAHLMARKNFLYLCLKANELTPFNFRIALN